MNRILLSLFSILLSLPNAWAYRATALYPPGRPPAETVTFADLRGKPMDTLLAATTLQGQVNRKGRAELYYIFRPAGEFWLQRLLDKGYTKETKKIPVDDLFEKYNDAYDRVLIYDPELPSSINVATMMASLSGGIVVSPTDSKRLGQGKEVEDLRGRWRSNIAAYGWALENLWPEMNHHLLACYHPTGVGHLLRDYLISNRVFHFFVTGEAEADQVKSHYQNEVLFVEDLLSRAPVNIPVLGFWYSGVDPGLNEYVGVGLASEYGKFTVVSDFIANLSLFSGVPVDLEKAVSDYRRRLDLPESPAEIEEKVYICYDIVESGDSPAYIQDRQLQEWGYEQRGQIPINWSQGPAILDLAPPIAEYFFETATPNDYLYTAISGAGYNHPYRYLNVKTPDPKAAWEGYIALTREAMQRMGCAELGLYTDSWRRFDREKNDPVTLRFIRGIPELDLLVLGMGRDEGMDATIGNYLLGPGDTVISHILTRWPADYAGKSREEMIQWLVEEIQSQTPQTRPAFLNVMALSWACSPAEILEVHRRLGEDYQALRLPEFTQMYRKHAEGCAE